MITLEGAYIREQGVEFGVIIVKQHVLNNRPEANRLIAQLQAKLFGGHPVVLMAQDYQGTPTYYGRRDIADFMARVPLRSVPWKHYTLN